MGWNRVLMVPHLVRLGARAPRDVSTRWDQYWAGVRTTGDGGDVLWDSSSPGEAQRYLDLLAAHADLRLPVVDIGCGNGRFTRALAGLFPHAVGVDLAAHAVTRAEEEAAGHARVEFRTGDMTLPAIGRTLSSALGPCNVFVRGVLHTLDVPGRKRLSANIRTLTRADGTVLAAETNYPGPLLGYLESLGAGARGLPRPLARAVSAGIPRPAPFGVDELDACFSPGIWDRVVVDDRAEITAVPMQRPGVPESIPALLAVLRPRGLMGSAQPDGRRGPAPVRP